MSTATRFFGFRWGQWPARVAVDAWGMFTKGKTRWNEVRARWLTICAGSAYSLPIHSAVMSLPMSLQILNFIPLPQFCSVLLVQPCWFIGKRVTYSTAISVICIQVWVSLGSKTEVFCLDRALMGGVSCGDWTGVGKPTLTILLWWLCDEWVCLIDHLLHLLTIVFIFLLISIITPTIALKIFVVSALTMGRIFCQVYAVCNCPSVLPSSWLMILDMLDCRKGAGSWISDCK